MTRRLTTGSAQRAALATLALGRPLAAALAAAGARDATHGASLAIMASR